MARVGVPRVTMNNKRRVLAAAAILSIVFGATLLAQTAPQATGDALVRVLVDEIRALRASLQKNSAFELRGRLLIDRARIHQETIRELSRELEGMSEAVRSADMNDIAFDVATETDARTAAVTNPEEKRRIEEQMKVQMERRKEMHARYVEQNRMRLQRLENRLADERDKLEAIERELAEIQRELTGAPR